MKLTKILKSKRGMAIENAVLFILIIFSLCSLMALMALTQHYQTKIDKIRFGQDIELEQIGEHFLAYLEGDEDSYTSYTSDFSDKYTCDIYGDTLVVRSKDGNVLLSAKAEVIDGKAAFVTLNAEEPDDTVKEIGKIGDYFLAYLEGGEENYTEYTGALNDKYSYEIYGCSLVVKSIDNGNVLLCVRATFGGGKATYASLSYSEPEDSASELDQIGTDFLDYIKMGTTEAFYPEALNFSKAYEYTVVGKALTVKKDSKTLLYIKTDDDAKILTWRYGEPTEDEAKTDQEAAKFLSYSTSFDSEKEVLNTTVTVPQSYEEKEFVVNTTQGVKISYDNAVLLSIQNVKLNSAPYDMVIFEKTVKIYKFVPRSLTPEQQ